MDFSALVDRVGTECGIVGVIGYLLAGWQTWELGRSRALREADRAQIVADAAARTAAAIAHGRAQEQMISVLMEERQRRHTDPPGR